MKEELPVLAQNGTWYLVPCTPNMNVVGCKWGYKTKLCADGTLESLKVNLVTKGFNQVEAIDFSETFPPAVKLISIRVILTMLLPII